MLFSSIIFIFYFLPVFLLAYYLAGWRTGVLLTGSVAFYVWGEGGYILLLAGLILVNYWGALHLDRAEGARRARLLAGLTALDLGVLVYFKYAGFLAANLNALLPGDPLPDLVQRLPLGISFFTFQLISYLVDVHRRATPVEPGLVKFSTYILMFPHLIAGPIVRYADIRTEMQADRRGSGARGLGVQYFITGLCQKVLIANTLAPLADHAFGLGAPDLATAWVGALAYALQLYFDFGGYSNMAIGLAFMLGFTFPRNFDHPYAARSVTEFWRRWHISLSSWFRDYVYIPLGGNRGGRLATLRNLLIVFALTGLWHGAAWTFLAWGLWHGGFLLLERAGLGRMIATWPRLMRHAYLLLAVGGGWVLFRSDSLPHAGAYFAAMAGLGGPAADPTALARLLDAPTLMALAAGVAFSGPLAERLLKASGAPLAFATAQDGGPSTRQVRVTPIPLLLAGFVLSVALLAGASLNPFLYFRF